MVPLSALMKVHADLPGRSAPCATTAFSTADINGGPAPGYLVRPGAGRRSSPDRGRNAAAGASPTSGPRSDATRRSSPATRRPVGVPRVAILLVFLVLAAQYESLTLPLAIILIVPMGLFAAMTGVWHLTHGDNNVFTQIGLDGAGRAVGEERDPDRRVRA